MALARASWSFLFLQLALLCSAQGREAPGSNCKEVDDKVAFDITKHVYREAGVDDVFRVDGKKANAITGSRGQEQDAEDHVPIYKMDPSLRIFFTVKDLEIGSRMPLYFPSKPDPSKTPRLLPREEAESIPFSSSQLSWLLDYFSFSEHSPQAKAMVYTLEQCELEPIEGEVKFCATSLEAMIDRARRIFGPENESRALTTTYRSMSNTASPLKNYTILQTPKQISARRMIGCHPMPYPYAVFYCHSQLQGKNRLYHISLGGPNGERVEAVAVCHMDTSKWDTDHVSFHVLNIEPRCAPVCHIFPVDNLIWVPVQS